MALDGPSGFKEASEVERMMKESGLREEDLDVVVFDEKEASKEVARWVALARVHTEKIYSETWFCRNMQSAWDLAQVLKFRPLEYNLYTIQFSCLGDCETLDTVEIWIQIHDVPDLYAHLVSPIAAKVGEVLFVEPPSHDFTENFYHVWVRINVTKPVKNVVSMIRDNKRQIYKVKYEKLPDWCAVFGMLGYLFKKHGNGIHPPLAIGL
ncbi:hypothetical protein D1007_01213 [Hordeum vulgare]|nr:hypothetical protein D1007_01213 [Hordeum vulgare]